MNGDVAPTFLVDGLAASTWRSENGRVVIESFAPLPRAVRTDVEDERARLGAFLAG